MTSDAARSWESAPKIVKNWAYLLTWLVIAVLTVVLVLIVVDSETTAAGKVGGAVFALAFIALNVWLNRALKAGRRAAWYAQLVLSILGLLGFPLGTIVHGYILFKWFTPETKAWFGA